MSICCLWHSMNLLFFVKHMASSRHFNIIYPELEAGIIAVTHIMQGSMPLLISGSSSPPPCSLCGSMALFPSAHCCSQRARLPVVLPQALSLFYSAYSLSTCESILLQDQWVFKGAVQFALMPKESWVKFHSPQNILHEPASCSLSGMIQGSSSSEIPNSFKNDFNK